MINLISTGDIQNVKDAVSQVVKDAIGQAATVLIPAIETAAKNALGSVTITVGPIHIDPIEITLGTKL